MGAMRGMCHAGTANILFLGDPILWAFVLARRSQPHKEHEFVLLRSCPFLIRFSQNEALGSVWVACLHLDETESGTVFSAYNEVIIQEVLW